MTEYNTLIQYKTTSKYFRDELLRFYPALKDTEFLKLAIWLIFSRFTDEETDNVVVPAELLARISGKHIQLDMGNFKSSKLLTKFSNEVAPLVVSGWSYANGKAREVESITWKSRVQQLIDQELRFEHKGERVYLLSGETYTNNKLKKKEQYQQMDSTLSLLRMKPVPEQIFIQQYINALPLGIFEAMFEKNFNDAVEVAKRLSNSEYHLGVLHNLRDDVKPVVKFVANSPRLFGSGMTLMNLKKEPRKVLMGGTEDIDVQNCQLRIIAKIWDIPEVSEILQIGSFWDYVMQRISLTKEQIKTATYTIIFGGTKKELRKQLGDDLEALIDLPIYKILLKARNKRKRQIKLAGGVTNAFGKWLPADRTNQRLRSLLAQEAQSYELAIMAAGFEEATKRDDGIIVLYQFDGVSIIGTKQFQEAVTDALEQKARTIEQT